LYFVEFLQFLIKLSLLQITSYKLGQTVKLFKIGERMKTPLDKVYRFIGYFLKELDLKVKVPKLANYQCPDDESEESVEDTDLLAVK
jgi:hypothetical protein